MEKFVEIMDTTLRDGEQTNGVSFLPHEKLMIARMLLQDLNVDRIEVASARVSEGEKEAVKSICRWAHQANMLERIDSHPNRIEQEIAQLQRRLEISTEQLAKPFEYTDELNKLLERKAFLDAQLEFGAADESSVLIDEDNEEGHEIA